MKESLYVLSFTVFSISSLFTQQVDPEIKIGLFGGSSTGDFGDTFISGDVGFGYKIEGSDALDDVGLL